MKNSWISCVTAEGFGRATRLALTWLILSSLVATAVGAKGKGKKERDPDELFNPLLGIEHSHWLVGPIAHLATDEEIDRYLMLTGDEQAVAFVEAFWADRNQDTPLFTDPPQKIFENRVAEADKRFREGAYPGSRTDRGTIYVLYGEPGSEEYEKPRKVGDPSPEIWRYDKDAPPGLDGERPQRMYRFIEIDGLTVFFREHMRRDPRLRDPRRRPGGRF